ncbi:MAG: bifunctional proline dehydrogenase/L-glutamate gamma-semialdehyde dehydrogenase PutA [Paracoccaceae bacterium]
MSKTAQIRATMRKHLNPDEGAVLRKMITDVAIHAETHAKITSRAIDLVEHIRNDARPGLMEQFLGEYGLSTDEGVALMCLAEALLRVPDADTIDALIEDKIAPSAWGSHLGRSHSSLVNASTWALFLTGKVLKDGENPGVATTLRGAVKRLGEPVIRRAVTAAMKEMGQQFVLGETIDKALKRAAKLEAAGYTYSYDMLGEAACTERDARQYHLAYSNAIGRMASAATSDDIRENPGISVKLSALHPRYEALKRPRVMAELVARTRSLALLAKSAGMGFNIDAEEANRLDLSLDVIEAVLDDPALKDWDGFGVVVQVYSPRASLVIDWLYDLATRLDRKIMVRLVKGAYWDTEIKLSQVEGHDGFPVFSRKPSTDVSYICCAKKLLGMADRIYPQFATHNAHTVAAVLEMAPDKSAFEFQRLHGMGEALHDIVLKKHATRCRIYAPVGAHKDLLAYLVRRLLENGANSSFVNQIVDESVPAADVVSDPFASVNSYLDDAASACIAKPVALFSPARCNSQGHDPADPLTFARIVKGQKKFTKTIWKPKANFKDGELVVIRNPANQGDIVGEVQFASDGDVNRAVAAMIPWADDVAVRANTLRQAADLFEQNSDELYALLTREAGKTILDCIGELREAVDFLRFYAAEVERVKPSSPCGIFTCISPWNFPLAIFSGQIAAALAAGNAVIAKPAESTPLIAHLAVNLLHRAGVPKSAFCLLPGHGAVVGAALSAHKGIGGLCFTGSTVTAQHINRAMAKNLSPDAPLIAETGGLNAMIVDSTALPEQAVRDIVTSAFQSAGQRCSALRVLYVQEDIADNLLEMLFGAMDELTLGDPADFTTDIGPVIDMTAKEKIEAHIDAARGQGRLLKQISKPDTGIFVAPAVVEISSISDLSEEVFGPVLHVVRYRAQDLDAVIDAINATGFGLTFGLHTRIDDRVQHVVDRVHAGNIYINRNQIGAVVGAQPFGGEGLSGTGPKAGGPNYLPRFCLPRVGGVNAHADPHILPGPTGESNQLSYAPKGRVLCLGPGLDDIAMQVEIVAATGAVPVTGDMAPLEALQNTQNLDVVLYWGDTDVARKLRIALAARAGMIIPLITHKNCADRLLHERHVCVDTTASGGNASLLAISG